MSRLPDYAWESVGRHESPILRAARVRVSRYGHRLFRNTVGLGYDRAGRCTGWYGLARFSGDGIGWKSIIITPDMVGQRLAVFLSVEVKAPGARTNPARRRGQQRWREAVQKAGGVAVEIDDDKQLDEVLR